MPVIHGDKLILFFEDTILFFVGNGSINIIYKSDLTEKSCSLKPFKIKYVHIIIFEDHSTLHKLSPSLHLDVNLMHLKNY